MHPRQVEVQQDDVRTRPEGLDVGEKCLCGPSIRQHVHMAGDPGLAQGFADEADVPRVVLDHEDLERCGRLIRHRWPATVAWRG